MGNAFPVRPQAGVCLHITSLPGDFGLGELGQAAVDFIDQLVAMDLRVWQILPTGPTAYGNSPYQPLSAFAGNELLLDTQQLITAGLVLESEAQALRTLPHNHVDFGRLVPAKTTILAHAAERFLAQASTTSKAAFEAFKAHHNHTWLHDYAVYRVIKSRHGESAWVNWRPEYRHRHSAAVLALEEQSAMALEHIKILQFLFHQQWQQLHSYASSRGVLLFGDIPIYLALDSSDVWANPALVNLDANNNPLALAGVPPDDFSADGQLWGNPIYAWDYHARTHYAWWISRVQQALQAVDLVRIDHFRGLESYWSIPFGSATAETGQWLPGPGNDLLDALYGAFTNPSLVAEDLGFMTEEVEAMRQKHQIPGMVVLQEKLADPAFSLNTIEPNSICYPGTHDTDTCRGWFDGGSVGEIRTLAQIEQSRQTLLRLTGGDAHSVADDMITLAFSSAANLAIVLMQDFIGLDNSARFNLPGTSTNNWRWRLLPEQLGPTTIAKVKRLVANGHRQRGGQSQVPESI
jgi:4-alpha-glucanotransferase